MKEVLGSEDYKQYATLLKNRFGKSADEVTTQDILQEKNKWVDEYLKKGEMPTFVDGFLYSIAKKQGKWLGGIEDITDQTNLEDVLLDKSDIAYVLADNKTNHIYFKKENEKSLNKMIGLYNDQDLEGIESFSNLGMVAQKKDLLLIKKKKKMARRMDSLAHLRTMFLAVGAAHLPGDSGVISLLRKRGFLVEPVVGREKIAAKKYKFTEVTVPWTEVRDKANLYKIAMPGPPTTITPAGMLEMKLYFDISEFKGFYIMAFSDLKKVEDSDSAYNAYATKIFNTKKVLPKPINMGGIKGREYYGKIQNYPSRLQLYFQGHTVYMLVAYSLRDGSLSDTSSQRFFNSFQPTILDSTSGSEDTFIFSDSIMGVQFHTPVTMSFNGSMSDTTSDNWRVSVWNGTDPTTGSLVMLLKKEVKPGFHIVNDNIIHDDFLTLLQAQYKNLEVKETSIEGKKAYNVLGTNIANRFYMRSLNTMKEGKAFFLFLMGDSSLISSSHISQSFESFRFIPHPITKWQYNSMPLQNFEVWTPSPIRAFKPKGNGAQYISYDTATGTTYTIILDTLNRFVWGKSDSSFLRNYLKNEFDKDSILTTSNLQKDSMGGISFLVKPEGASNVYKRLSYWLNGHQIFKLVTYGSMELVNSENVDRFFTGFKVKSLAEDHLSQVDPADVYKNLSSPDSALRNEAHQALSQIPFDKEDLPLLHSALFKKYPSLGDYDRGDINWAISEKISKLGDSSSIDFIMNQYDSLIKNDTLGREVAVTTLANMQTL
ncbi:MAG: hypothetical protein DI598_07545 [Pseudopedobacter saltans]|uniref:TraB/GumN family protein n=1 Tax=Pseudopedobacter saltans TaxID=151895 RepID=A0A2W5F5J5_9SPHI|nr:MAG: hypothetical protein DI598_07545 [Pseudopedobacter saltans]